MGIKVLPTRMFFEKDIIYIKSKLTSDCEFIIPEDYSIKTLKKYAPQADILFGGLISKELCAEAPKLRFIQVPWTGVDNLNFKEIAEIGVPVCNSHSNAAVVAEHAVSLMFSVAKKIVYHDAELRKGNWNRPKPDASNLVSPFSKRISGSNVAIIGYGHIGKYIHKMLTGLECKFLIADPNIGDKNDIPNSKFFTPKQLSDILPQADFVFISVPLIESTEGLVNVIFLDEMKNTSILINISRGEVINEDDLYNALDRESIAGAGIDTWYNYPKNHDEPTFPSTKNNFEKFNNLIMSPHRSAMVEGELPHLDDAIENINRAAKGLEPKNIISVKNKY